MELEYNPKFQMGDLVKVKRKGLFSDRFGEIIGIRCASHVLAPEYQIDGILINSGWYPQKRLVIACRAAKREDLTLEGRVSALEATA